MGLGDETYVNLATVKRDGNEVRTPVWIAPDGDRLIVWTNANAWKVKRVRNTARVRLAPCDVRGGIQGDWVDATARVLDDPNERDAALEALFRKYGWQMQLARIGGSITGHWRQRGAIEITLGASAA